MSLLKKKTEEKANKAPARKRGKMPKLISAIALLLLIISIITGCKDVAPEASTDDIQLVEVIDMDRYSLCIDDLNVIAAIRSAYNLKVNSIQSVDAAEGGNVKIYANGTVGSKENQMISFSSDKAKVEESKQEEFVNAVKLVTDASATLSDAEKISAADVNTYLDNLHSLLNTYSSAFTAEPALKEDIEFVEHKSLSGLKDKVASFVITSALGENLDEDLITDVTAITSRVDAESYVTSGALVKGSYTKEGNVSSAQYMIKSASGNNAYYVTFKISTENALSKADIPTIVANAIKGTPTPGYTVELVSNSFSWVHTENHEVWNEINKEKADSSENATDNTTDNDAENVAENGANQ